MQLPSLDEHSIPFYAKTGQTPGMRFTLAGAAVALFAMAPIKAGAAALRGAGRKLEVSVNPVGNDPTALV
jgi:hypothetical protein